MLTKTRLIYLAIMVLYCSCFRGENKAPKSSASFDSTIARTERIYDSGDKQQALAYIMSQHATLKNLTLEDDMNYYAYVAEFYRKESKDFDLYVTYADSMLYLLDKGNHEALPIRYVQAYNMKADALFNKGLYIESHDYYYKAKKLAQETFDSCSLSKFSYSLGMVLFRQLRYQESAQRFIESINESESCADKFVFFYLRQEVLDNIGLCFYHLGKYDSAMIYYNKAIDYIDANYMRFDKNESVYISAKAVVLGNMADLYIQQKKYDTAYALLNKSIAINLQKGYTNTDALIDQVKLARLHLSQGDMAETNVLLQQIKAELDSIPDTEERVERSWNQIMAQYYDQAKDSVKAHRYLLAYQRLNDAHIARNKKLMTTDVDGRIRSAERQNDILLLQKKREQERMYRIVASVVAVMAVIIIFMIGRNMQKTRKHVRMLTDLNNQVNDQKEKLQVALTELELKDRDRSRILRSVAHDVMNPIAAIMAFIDILLTSGDEYTDEQREIFGLIKEACNNSLGLSKDIMEASTDHTKMAREWIDVHKLVTGSVDLLSFRAQAKKQHLVITADADKDVKAFVNKEKIWRVVNNLIGNAIKFSHDGGEIVIDIRAANGKVDISVKDSGVGIPEKNKPLIFDMFTEAKTPGTSGETPHGLGLSISLQIAKAHYGTIWFESEEGKGSTFHLVLPLNAQEVTPNP